MRIATYNLWNSTFDWERRLYAAMEELAMLDADVVGMQEAPTHAPGGRAFTDFLRDRTNYPHALHVAYPVEPDESGRPEGLAFLSKLPLEDVRFNWEDEAATANNWAAKVVVDWHGASLGIANVHLDWEQAASRERHMDRIVQELIYECGCQHDILCGDFNEDVDSPVSEFLEARESSAGRGAQWRDLARSWHSALGEAAPVTVDFTGNPRWKGQTVDSAPARFDRIYLRSGESSRDLRVVRAGLFGKAPSNRFGIVPSDHYGVFVDLEVPA